MLHVAVQPYMLRVLQIEIKLCSELFLLGVSGMDVSLVMPRGEIVP